MGHAMCLVCGVPAQAQEHQDRNTFHECSSTNDKSIARQVVLSQNCDGFRTQHCRVALKQTSLVDAGSITTDSTSSKKLMLGTSKSPRQANLTEILRSKAQERPKHVSTLAAKRVRYDTRSPKGKACGRAQARDPNHPARNPHSSTRPQSQTTSPKSPKPTQGRRHGRSPLLQTLELNGASGCTTHKCTWLAHRGLSYKSRHVPASYILECREGMCVSKLL